jgi:hypothetical protein
LTRNLILASHGNGNAASRKFDPRTALLKRAARNGPAPALAVDSDAHPAAMLATLRGEIGMQEAAVLAAHKAEKGSRVDWQTKRVIPPPKAPDKLQEK